MNTGNDQYLIFCKNIRNLRIANKITKKDMAKIMEIGTGTLTKIENGERLNRTGVKIIILINKHFKISPDQLFESEIPLHKLIRQIR